MKISFHQGMNFEDWKSLSFSHQILNIVSEMNRVKNWMKKDDALTVRQSLDRVYELTDLTIEANRDTIFLREFLIFRECLGSFYFLENYTDETIQDFVALMRCLVDFDPEAHLIKESLAA